MFSGNGGTPNATWLIGADEEGVLEEIRTPGELPEEVADLSFNVKPGDSIRRFASGRDRIGQIIVRGSDAQDCRRRIEDLLKDIVIKVR